MINRIMVDSINSVNNEHTAQIWILKDFLKRDTSSYEEVDLEVVWLIYCKISDLIHISKITEDILSAVYEKFDKNIPQYML